MRQLLFFSVFFYSFIIADAQKSKMVIPRVDDKDQVIHKGSKLFTTPSDGSLFPKDIKEDWNIALKNLSTYYHNGPWTREEFKRLKDEANAVRNNRIKSNDEVKVSSRSLAQAPVLVNNFRGNIRGNSIPMDNTMAVSRNGFVVSGINSTMIFTMPDGKVTFNRSFADFYKILGLGSSMFDPRIIYDQAQNRFIVVCLHGSVPSTSYICIAFSKTEDPNGEWNFYKIKGNPLADDVWFDFPNIAVSEDDLYIGGNMFTEGGNYRYSMLFQVSKTDGYAGDELTWKYYDRVSTTTGSLAFNPVPAMSGWETLTSPGIYVISHSNGNYNINYTDESVKNNPRLYSIRAVGPSFSFPPEGRQKDVTIKLNTGGNRLRTAMYQRGVLHFAAQANTPAGDGGIFYARIDLNNLKVTSDVLTAVDRDYAYPTITSFGNSEEDDRMLINYTFTGPDVYPGQAARVVSGRDGVFNWSEEIVFREGQSAIGSGNDETIRWGDYTGASRRFGVNRIESWAVGTFGENRRHSTWIGQFVGVDDMDKPVMEFTASKTTTVKDTIITFRDISNTIPKGRKWIFEAGSPPTSEEEFPVVKYDSNGVYDVTLISTFDERTDSFTKTEFIHILDPVVKPEAIWVNDKDTIYVGDSIQFTSLSSANALTHKWTFINGTPSTSAENNPVVIYKKKGSNLVSLSVANTAGSTASTKNKAITVLEKAAPQAAFSSDKAVILPGDSILFTNQSKDAKSLKWTFEDGLPAESTITSPVVTYNNSGNYRVKLVATNDFGVDSVTNENFVVVGTSSNVDIPTLSGFTLYPNPVSASTDFVTIRFTNQKTGIYKVDLYNLQGILIKTLHQDKIKSGENILTFNANMLSKGQYYVSFTSDIHYKTLSFIVVE